MMTGGCSRAGEKVDREGREVVQTAGERPERVRAIRADGEQARGGSTGPNCYNFPEAGLTYLAISVWAALTSISACIALPYVQ
jgi:hypothetical protein